MTALAAERYQTEKDKYALVPEERYSSHILLLCEPGVCDRDARRVEAQKILDELKAGADFRELAGKYSEDPGSKDEGGQFDALADNGRRPTSRPNTWAACSRSPRSGATRASSIPALACTSSAWTTCAPPTTSPTRR